MGKKSNTKEKLRGRTGRPSGKKEIRRHPRNRNVHSHWKFKNSHNSSEERLLSLLFGIDTVKEHTRRQDYLNYMRNDFDKVRDIPGVHLTKILRKELERKEKTTMTK